MILSNLENLFAISWLGACLLPYLFCILIKPLKDSVLLYRVTHCILVLPRCIKIYITYGYLYNDISHIMINLEIFIFVINQQFSNRKINWSACSGVKKFFFSNYVFSGTEQLFWWNTCSDKWKKFTHTSTHNKIYFSPFIPPLKHIIFFLFNIVPMLSAGKPKCFLTLLLAFGLSTSITYSRTAILEKSV